jgi:hypothetical protein
MMVTQLTRDLLDRRRIEKRLIAAGFEEIDERGGKLWQLHRGARYDHVITEAVIAPGGKTLFIKTAPVTSRS